MVSKLKLSSILERSSMTCARSNGVPGRSNGVSWVAEGSISGVGLRRLSSDMAKGTLEISRVTTRNGGDVPCDCTFNEESSVSSSNEYSAGDLGLRWELDLRRPCDLRPLMDFCGWWDLRDLVRRIFSERFRLLARSSAIGVVSCLFTASSKAKGAYPKAHLVV